MAKEDRVKTQRADKVSTAPDAKTQCDEIEALKEKTVEVVNAGARCVHTSRGKMVKDATKALPETEAAALVKKGLVKTV